MNTNMKREPESNPGDLLKAAADALRHSRLDEARDLLDRYDVAHPQSAENNPDSVLAACLREFLDNRHPKGISLLHEKLLPALEGLSPDQLECTSHVVNILHACGEWDESLRLAQDYLLPLYERQGDLGWRAITFGQIADTLFMRGDLDEALRIRREEVIPVYTHLGDTHYLIIANALLAMGLIQRRRPEDYSEVVDLLIRALADARRLQLPREIEIVESIIRSFDLDPHAPPFAKTDEPN